MPKKNDKKESENVVLLPETFQRGVINALIAMGMNQPSHSQNSIYQLISVTSRKVNVGGQVGAILIGFANASISNYEKIADRPTYELTDQQKAMKREANSSRLFLKKIGVEYEPTA